MKFLNPICLFICILALCFSACFTPNSPAASLAASPADSPAGDTDTTVFNDTELFTVTIAIAGDGQSRSVAGLPRDKLKAGSGVRNFAQLIVLDTKSKKLMGFAEIHQSGDITINALPLGKTYAFLLLMGHWKGEEGQDGQWVPAPDDPFPTLLNAGLTEYILNAGDSAKIGIVMYPLVVNTVFTEQVESGSGQTVHPLVEEGKPKPAYLFPGNWTVNWAIQRTNPGTDGLERLIAAQAIMESTGYDLEPDHYTGGELKIQKLRYITPDGPWEPEPGITSTTKDISYDISAYTQATGSGGAVNFNVEYVPFNLTAAADWRIAYNGQWADTAFGEGNTPKWIIRNGVNDLAPDENTNFAGFGNTGSSANANGAIRFVAGTDAEAPPAAFTAVTGITNVPAVIRKGETLTLSGTVVPNNATNKTIVWTVKDAKNTGASITGSNRLKFSAAATGKAVITAAIDNGKSPGTAYTQDFEIAVFVPVTGIDFSSSTTMNNGGSLTLSGTVAPDNATNKTISWTVKSGGASISGRTLTAYSAGTVKVTAAIDNGKAPGTAYTQDFEITVNSFEPATEIVFASANGLLTDDASGAYYIYAGYEYPVKAKVSPAGATNQAVTWSTSNSTIAEIRNNANMYGFKYGRFDLIATIPNGKPSGDFVKKFTVNVKSYTHPETFVPNWTTGPKDGAGRYKVGKNKSYSLDGVIYPQYALWNKKVNWNFSPRGRTEQLGRTPAFCVYSTVNEGILIADDILNVPGWSASLYIRDVPVGTVFTLALTWYSCTIPPRGNFSEQHIQAYEFIVVEE